MADLLKALTLSIGEAALATHRKTCEVCSDDYDCVIAKAHLRKLADVRSSPVAVMAVAEDMARAINAQSYEPRSGVDHLIELRGVYDGWSIAVHKDGTLRNRWAEGDGTPSPGYERRFYATEAAIADLLDPPEKVSTPPEPSGGA